MSTDDGHVIGITRLAGSKARGAAFNLVLLAEGFTLEQQPQFDAACERFSVTLLGVKPFDELRENLNCFRVNVVSRDPGAGDPQSSGGTGASPRTYFDASFGYLGVRRLLVCNVATALAVAADLIPEFHIVLVIVNSEIYGGSGGSAATFSLADSATEIAIHELGHTAFGLADEYAYYSSPQEAGHERHPPIEPPQPNITIRFRREELKWKDLIDPLTNIPCMTNDDCIAADSRLSDYPLDTVGLFEGAGYFHCGAYRAQFDCKMRNLGKPFCRVCEEIIKAKIRSLCMSR